MNRTELASLLQVDIKTLKNWENNKPELVRLINLGLKTDKTIEQTRDLLKKLEEIESKASSGKLQLK
jgi:DNA-binding XRE family transcriptional regulator